MNIFKKKSVQNTIDYKSRLEYKLYLAREDPEPTFDLSECNLKSVPSGVYSLCKVFRKERLLLQINQLTSLSGGGLLSDLCLLSVLDLHNNRLPVLPDEISCLTNLQDLNVSYNELKKLPESISSLFKLRVLDCSHNRLSELPDLGQLTCLTTLALQGNPLPSDLLKQQCSLVQQHQHTEESIPSSKSNSSESTFKENQSAVDTKVEETSSSEENYVAQDVFKLLAKRKEEKLQELVEVERNLQEQKKREFKTHENMKKDKNKLLLTLKEQQRKLEEDVTRFHKLKEQERSKLLNYLLEVESQTDEMISDLLTLNKALHRLIPWKEQDRREQEMLAAYKSKNHELRRSEVIDAMELLLSEECSRNDKLRAYEKHKTEVCHNSLLREVEWGQQLRSLLKSRDARQSALISEVEADIEMQKALVATLLERSDLQSQSLIMQMALVQQQMAVLTAVELQRRNLDSQQHLIELTEKRKTLSELLVGLLQEQSERQKHLVNKLQQLDFDNEVSRIDPDFWLHQYQHLLDMGPHELRSTLTQLTQASGTNDDEQHAITEAVNAFLGETDAQLLPSAPPPPGPVRDYLPECVVCMESECAIVFLPCGHLCTCATCASQLFLCPLCRASLESKIYIILP